MGCGCGAKTNAQVAVDFESVPNNLAYFGSTSSYNCPPMEKALSIKYKLDNYLNTNTEPEGVTRDELIDMIPHLIHVINMGTTCGNVELLEEYEGKLGI